MRPVEEDKEQTTQPEHKTTAPLSEGWNPVTRRRTMSISAYRSTVASCDSAASRITTCQMHA